MTPQLERKLSGTVHVPQATQCTLTEGLVVRNNNLMPLLFRNLSKLETAANHKQSLSLVKLWIKLNYATSLR